MITRGDTNATLKDLTIVVEDTLAETQPQLHPLICGMMHEDGAYTKIPVPAHIAMPRKWEGERSSQGKDVNVVQNYDQDTYELTIDIDSDLIRNAKAYDQAAILREGVMSAKIFPSYLASQAVLAGTSNNGYDGNPFYGATHKYAKMGSNNFSNLVTKTGVTVSALQADMNSALTKIRTSKDNQGRLLNPLASQGKKNLLVHCPAAMELAFKQLVFGTINPITVPVTTSGTTAVGGSNMAFEGIAEIYADGYLDATSASEWYLHYVGMPQRPFVFIENYPLEAQLLGLGTEFEINHKAVRFAFKHRFVLGYYRFDRSVRVA